MFNAATLAFSEFMRREPVPLAAIQEALFEFLRGRNDAVLFGAQAVNAYVGEPRATEDVDLLSTRAPELAGEIRAHLSERFHIAFRIREIGAGRGYRVFQLRKGGNRHIADIRPVPAIPPFKRIARVRVLAPADLIATKLIAYHARRGQPKSGTDWRDLALLLLAFPGLKDDPTEVAKRLDAAGAGARVLQAWRKLAAAPIEPPRPDEEF